MQIDIEAEIQTRIRAKTQHMMWRPNWEGWVQGRMWQERYQEPVVSNLKRYVPNWQKALVLDLGCGMGGTIVRLLQEGVRTIGLDICYDYCVITKLRGMRYGLDTSVVCGAGEAIPLKDASVDVILCYETIEQVFNPMALLREIRRIIRPNGLVFITAPNRWTLYDHHYHLWGISYLPRRGADWLIERLGRGKGNDVSAGY